MAVMWGVSLSAVIFAVGSAYDYSKISTARHISQDAADLLALTASASVRDLGHVPTDNTEGFVHAQKYYLEDFDINLDPYFNVRKDSKGRDLIGDRPSFKVYYDTPHAGEVKVVITGKAKPAFMQLAGVDFMDFSSDSIVTYELLDIKDPASIVLVLDNSGSMDETDDDDISREDEMEAVVKDFMADMTTIIPQDEDGNDENVLRTGMISYYSQYDPNLSVPMAWGTVSDADIDALWAGGGTNSAAGMSKAKQWLDGEDAIHDSSDAETPNDNPLKFVVLMTDGVNNSTWMDSSTVTTCTNLKADDNTFIYTIGFAINSTRSSNMLTNCATSPDHYFPAEDAEALNQVFENIGKNIVEETIRIRS